MKNLILGTQNFIHRSECFNAYVRSLRRYATELSAEEEAELFMQIQKGGMTAQRAQERIVTAHSLFVVSCAIHYASSSKKYEVEDLIEQGNEGLIHAVTGYDVNQGNRFLSYAVYYIRLYILDYMHKNGSIVYVPENRQRQMDKYKNLCREETYSENGLLTAEEFADSMGISVSDADSILHAYNEPVYIDEAFYDDSETTYGDMMISDSYTDSYQDEDDRRYAVHESMKSLKAREAYIVNRTYGLNDDCACEHNFTDIASELNLNPETVRLSYERSLKKLRKSSVLREYMAA